MRLIRVLTLRNIGPNPVSIGVDPPINVGTDPGTDVTGTDITSSDDTGFTTLFYGEGIVIINPGRTFSIEEDRVNLGQIENLQNLKALQVQTLIRDVSDLTSGN